jgi:hypothetical protein
MTSSPLSDVYVPQSSVPLGVREGTYPFEGVQDPFPVATDEDQFDPSINARAFRDCPFVERMGFIKVSPSGEVWAIYSDRDDGDGTMMKLYRVGTSWVYDGIPVKVRKQLPPNPHGKRGELVTENGKVVGCNTSPAKFEAIFQSRAPWISHVLADPLYRGKVSLDEVTDDKKPLLKLAYNSGGGDPAKMEALTEFRKGNLYGIMVIIDFDPYEGEKALNILSWVDPEQTSSTVRPVRHRMSRSFFGLALIYRTATKLYLDGLTSLAKGYPVTIEDAAYRRGPYFSRWMTVNTMAMCISCNRSYQEWYSLEKLFDAFHTGKGAETRYVQERAVKAMSLSRVAPMREARKYRELSSFQKIKPYNQLTQEVKNESLAKLSKGMNDAYKHDIDEVLGLERRAELIRLLVRQWTIVLTRGILKSENKVLKEVLCKNYWGFMAKVNYGPRGAAGWAWPRHAGGAAAELQALALAAILHQKSGTFTVGNIPAPLLPERKGPKGKGKGKKGKKESRNPTLETLVLDPKRIYECKPSQRPGIIAHTGGTIMAYARMESWTEMLEVSTHSCQNDECPYSQIALADADEEGPDTLVNLVDHVCHSEVDPRPQYSYTQADGSYKQSIDRTTIDGDDDGDIDALDHDVVEFSEQDGYEPPTDVCYPCREHDKHWQGCLRCVQNDIELGRIRATETSKTSRSMAEAPLVNICWNGLDAPKAPSARNITEGRNPENLRTRMQSAVRNRLFEMTPTERVRHLTTMGVNEEDAKYIEPVGLAGDSSEATLKSNPDVSVALPVALEREGLAEKVDDFLGITPAEREVFKGESPSVSMARSISATRRLYADPGAEFRRRYPELPDEHAEEVYAWLISKTVELAEKKNIQPGIPLELKTNLALAAKFGMILCDIYVHPPARRAPALEFFLVVAKAFSKGYRFGVSAVVGVGKSTTLLLFLWYVLSPVTECCPRRIAAEMLTARLEEMFQELQKLVPNYPKPDWVLATHGRKKIESSEHLVGPDKIKHGWDQIAIPEKFFTPLQGTYSRKDLPSVLKMFGLSEIPVWDEHAPEVRVTDNFFQEHLRPVGEVTRAFSEDRTERLFPILLLNPTSALKKDIKQALVNLLLSYGKNPAVVKETRERIVFTIGDNSVQYPPFTDKKAMQPIPWSALQAGGIGGMAAKTLLAMRNLPSFEGLSDFECHQPSSSPYTEVLVSVQKSGYLLGKHTDAPSNRPEGALLVVDVENGMKTLTIIRESGETEEIEIGSYVASSEEFVARQHTVQYPKELSITLTWRRTPDPSTRGSKAGQPKAKAKARGKPGYFWLEKAETPQPAPEPQASASSAAEEAAPPPNVGLFDAGSTNPNIVARRNDLKREVFRVLATYFPKHGLFLTIEGTEKFARETGFKGSSNDWAKEYQSLCLDRGCDPTLGLSFKAFCQFVDDPSDKGCMCSNDELHVIKQLFFEAVLKDSSDALKEDQAAKPDDPPRLSSASGAATAEAESRATLDPAVATATIAKLKRTNKKAIDSSDEEEADALIEGQAEASEKDEDSPTPEPAAVYVPPQKRKAKAKVAQVASMTDEEIQAQLAERLAASKGALR